MKNALVRRKCIKKDLLQGNLEQLIKNAETRKETYS